jgi:vacuolar-type H+-ATPase subunit I/STV1
MTDTENTVMSNSNDNNDNNDNDNTKTESASITSQLTIYNVVSGNIFQSNACNRIVDGLLIIISLSSLGFGIVAWFVIDNITAIGYIMSGCFSSLSLFTIKRMRLRASLQSSVNVLKEENDELKENNDELKENIDELEENIDSLETISKTLRDDLIMFKETIGIFGENSDEIIHNLREIYNNLKSENEIRANINKNSIYLHILHIIKHYDKRSQFILTSADLDKAKVTLLNAFPNLNYDELKKKITNNKITADKIMESIKIGID